MDLRATSEFALLALLEQAVATARATLAGAEWPRTDMPGALPGAGGEAAPWRP